MRKVGKANVVKAARFHLEQNWVQALRYSELAATKLKKLKDRRLETVQDIDTSLMCKFDALQGLDRQREALECTKECYTLWAMNHMRNPGSVNAALYLIQSCIHNKEYEDAEGYARHAYFMIAEMTDNFIPSDQQPRFLADGSNWLAQSILCLAEAGGIPPEGKQKAGEEAITLARQALEIHTQLFGTESVDVARCMGTLSDAQEYFNNIDDDEVLRLFEQAIAIYRRLDGSTGNNVAVGENKLGMAYINRAKRALGAGDVDRCMDNQELALPHFREAARIYSTNNLVDRADKVLRRVATIEGCIRQVGIFRAAVTTASRG